MIYYESQHNRHTCVNQHADDVLILYISERDIYVIFDSLKEYLASSIERHFFKIRLEFEVLDLIDVCTRSKRC